MSILTSGTWPRLLLPGIRTVFGEDFKRREKIHEKIFELRTSDKHEETDVELYGTGVATVMGEGAPVGTDNIGQGLIQRYNHVQYGKSLVITKIAIEDNLYRSHISRMAPEISKSIVEAMEVEGANILNRAFNNSYTYADGQPLCDTDKVVSRTGSTFANKPATASDLSELSLENAFHDIAAIVGSDGLRAKLEVKKLIIPEALRFDAARLTMSDLKTSSADNDINTIKAMSLIPETVVWHYLTDNDAWFLLTDCPDGLIKYTRRPVSIDSDNEFTTDNMVFKGTTRFSFGSSNQRCIYGNAGA
jgi:hypothetical protein